jgi:Tfp pilus assembly protein PilV
MTTARPWAGFSIAELLVTVTVIGLLLAPLMNVLTQDVFLQRQLKTLNSRDLLVTSQANRLSTPLNTFTATFNNQSVVHAANSTIKVSPSNSTVFNRQAYLYVYNNASATGTSWTDGIPLNAVGDSFYMDVGNTGNPVTDSAGNLWQPDALYDSTNAVAGYVTSYGGTVPSASSNSITNSTTDTLYQTYREGADLRYSMPVPNDTYLVEVHAVELSGSINGTAGNRRRMDLYLESIADADTPVGTSLSPFELTGAANLAIALRYTVTVSDGVLNIRVKRSSSSDNDPQIMGIAVYPTGIKS